MALHPGRLPGPLRLLNHIRLVANGFDKRPDVAAILLNNDVNNPHEAFINPWHLFILKAFIDHTMKVLPSGSQAPWGDDPRVSR